MCKVLHVDVVLRQTFHDCNYLPRIIGIEKMDTSNTVRFHLIVYIGAEHRFRRLFLLVLYVLLLLSFFFLFSLHTNVTSYNKAHEIFSLPMNDFQRRFVGVHGYPFYN